MYFVSSNERTKYIVESVIAVPVHYNVTYMFPLGAVPVVVGGYGDSFHDNYGYRRLGTMADVFYEHIYEDIMAQISGTAVTWSKNNNVGQVSFI